MENVTRDVISDLWPLYKAEETSRDTRLLIEAFLREDPEFAQTLAELDRERFPVVETPSLKPDHELRTLERLRKRLTGPITLLQLALVFSCFAFGTLVSDTSFDVSPRRFIVTAVIALCFWVAFLVRLLKGRRDVLIRVAR
jgi:hypothetical protein